MVLVRPNATPSLISIVIARLTTSRLARSLAVGAKRHKTFALRVGQITTFTRAPSVIEHQRHKRQLGEIEQTPYRSGNPARSAIALPSPASVGRCARKINTAVAASCQYRLLSPEPMKTAIFHNRAITPAHSPSSVINRSRTKYSI